MENSNLLMFGNLFLQISQRVKSVSKSPAKCGYSAKFFCTTHLTKTSKVTIKWARNGEVSTKCMSDHQSVKFTLDTRSTLPSTSLSRAHTTVNNQNTNILLLWQKIQTRTKQWHWLIMMRYTIYSNTIYIIYILVFHRLYYHYCCYYCCYLCFYSYYCYCIY